MKMWGNVANVVGFCENGLLYQPLNCFSSDSLPPLLLLISTIVLQVGRIGWKMSIK